jgi:hypothetical protein
MIAMRLVGLKIIAQQPHGRAWQGAQTVIRATMMRANGAITRG